jgi:hypothetical protein
VKIDEWPDRRGNLEFGCELLGAGYIYEFGVERLPFSKLECAPASLVDIANK